MGSSPTFGTISTENPPFISQAEFEKKVFRAMESTGASEEDARRVVLEFYRAKAMSVLATDVSDIEVYFRGRKVDYSQ